MEGEQGRLAHLPDGSQELAAAADVSVALDGCTLPLHSQVLASGSRVLRTVLLSTGGAAASSGEVAGSGSGGGGRLDPTAAAAVQRAFEGHSLQDATQFLKLLYSPVAVADTPASLEALRGAIRLADKLDAPAVLEVRCFSSWLALPTKLCWCATAIVIAAAGNHVHLHLNRHPLPPPPPAGVRLAPGTHGSQRLAGMAAPGGKLPDAAPAAQGSPRRAARGAVW